MTIVEGTSAMADYNVADALLDEILQMNLRKKPKFQKNAGAIMTLTLLIAISSTKSLCEDPIAPKPTATELPSEEMSASKSDMATLIKTLSDLKNQVEQVTHKLSSVTAQLNIVTNELRKVQVALRNVNEPEKLPKIITFDCTEMLPLKNYDDLLTFEKNVDLEDFKLYLFTIGGQNLQRMVANLVAAVYSVDLQVSTTWKGMRSPIGDWSKPPTHTTMSPKVIA